MDEDVMTSQRFREMIAAYGADAARWPQDERAAGMAFVAAHGVMAQAWLDEARALDAWLDIDREAAGEASERLHYQTVARMVAANDVTVQAAPPRRLPLMWAAGAGLVACLAGALLGVNFGLRSLDDQRAQAVLEQAQIIDAENG